MGDAGRRELQRSFGSEEEEAAWLVDRLRAGELDEERLTLAAWCGHRPASLAISQDLSGLSQQAWLESIPAHSELRKRIAVAAGRLAHEAWLRDHPDWVEEYGERRTIIQVFLRPPPAASNDELEVILWEGIEGVLVTSSVRYDRVLQLAEATTTSGFAASLAVRWAAIAACEHRGRVVTAELQEILGQAAQAWEHPRSKPLFGERGLRERRRHPRGLVPCEEIPESPALRERVRSEVVPWLLNRKRPLLTLIAKRKMDIDLSELC
jgi:hypothetical protein